MNMGPHTNVDTPINFRFNALGAVEQEVRITDPDTRSPLTVSPPSSFLPSLSSRPARPLRTSIARNAANQTFAEALRIATQGPVDSASSLEATGEVDAARYGRALRSRRLIEVRGAGTTYDGTYYVKEVVHRIQRFPTAQYKMSFTLTRDGLGATSTSVGPQSGD
jgi:hypothetical protein